jgi:curved DNA-binding protein
VVGNDVELDLPVAPWELALGARVEIPTLTGSASTTVPAGTPAGRVMRLRGLGWPTAKANRGDLVVRLTASVPHSETEAQRTAYESLREAFRNCDTRLSLLEKAKL